MGPFLNDGKHHDNIDALQMIYREKAFEFKSRTWSVIFYGDEEFLQKEPIQNIGDAHFRLALMSRLKCKPNTLCLDNLFETLPVLVWQGNKVFTVEDWNRNEWAQPDSLDIVVDKIPLLLFGAPIPAGVRMPNPKSARLGAYLSPGTTIMHYGFVNFNAGTLGKAMVEGTIASGVTIDEGTDIGKGGGFLGTLSGGNKIKISTGKNCLIGAQAECGIPLGDNCVVATGVCFTANTPFMDVTGENVDMQRKAIEFAGKDNLTFRRNSLEGCLEVILQGNKSHLNESLHANSTADTVAHVS